MQSTRKQFLSEKLPLSRYSFFPSPNSRQTFCKYIPSANDLKVAKFYRIIH